MQNNSNHNNKTPMKHNTDRLAPASADRLAAAQDRLRRNQGGINFEPSLDQEVRQFAADDHNWETAKLGCSDTVMHTMPLHWSKKAKHIISDALLRKLRKSPRIQDKPDRPYSSLKFGPGQNKNSQE